MTSEARDRRTAAHEAPSHSRPAVHAMPAHDTPAPAAPAAGGAAPPFSIAAFAAALVAGLVGHFLPGGMGIAAAVVAAVFGAVAVALLSGPGVGLRRAASEELTQARE